MAEETKPVEEVAAEAAVEKPVTATPAAAPEEAVKRPAKQKDIFAQIEGDSEEDNKPKRRMKGAKNVPYGIAFIKTTFNNTIVSLTDMRGQVVSWSSAGRCGFKGSRKSTAFAATTVAQEAARGAITHGMNEVEVRRPDSVFQRLKTPPPFRTTVAARKSSAAYRTEKIIKNTIRAG
jgi:small subunit ribosomal protein S11